MEHERFRIAALLCWRRAGELAARKDLSRGVEGVVTIGSSSPDPGKGAPRRLTKKAYEAELARLQVELLYMEEWVHAHGLRVVVIFEGRDTAGKGGTIKRVTQLLNPRFCRVV